MTGWKREPGRNHHCGCHIRRYYFLILIFGKYLMGIFTETKEPVELSMHLMQILAVGYIAMAVTQCLSGVMRGAGDTHDTHVDIPDNYSGDSCPSRIRDRLDDKNAGASQRKE